jgi:hypothetical protein
MIYAPYTGGWFTGTWDGATGALVWQNALNTAF